MQKQEIGELIRLVEENIGGEFDKGPEEFVEAEEGDVVMSDGDPVPLEFTLEYDFQINDQPDMFQTYYERAQKYQEAVSELSIRLAKLVAKGVLVTRPLTTTPSGGTLNKDGIFTYTDIDWDAKPRVGSHTISMVGDKFWLRSEERYDSRKKATVVEIDILYGILEREPA